MKNLPKSAQSTVTTTAPGTEGINFLNSCKIIIDIPNTATAIRLMPHRFWNTSVIEKLRSSPSAAGTCCSQIIKPIHNKNHWSADVGIKTIYLLRRKTAMSKMISHHPIARSGRYAIPYVIAIGRRIQASDHAGP